MKLAPGQYLGQCLHEQEEDGLRLVLTDYQPAPRSPPHTHVHSTFFILLRGRHRDCLSVEDHDQAPLTAVFHPTTVSHATETGPQGMRGLNVEMSSTWLAQHALEEGRLSRYRVLASPWLQRSLVKLLGIAFMPGAVAAAERQSIAVELLEDVTADLERISGRRPLWLPKAQEFLGEHFREPISLRDVACAVGVHPVYCARVFRRVLRSSVSSYLRQLRLAEATRLVMQEGLSLAQAACCAGFADQSHLTRVYRSLVGFPPKRLLTPYLASHS